MAIAKAAQRRKDADRRVAPQRGKKMRRHISRRVPRPQVVELASSASPFCIAHPEHAMPRNESFIPPL